MCGIFGIVCKQDKLIGPTLIEAGLRLSYRGYDSVGIATISENGKIDLRKDAGKVITVAEKFNFKEMTGQRGILQLRWATFGEPSMVNAQPHLDSEGLMVGAHNGNVVNNSELREEFIAEGMNVRSTNDGESCVHAVERYIYQGDTMVNAIRKAYSVLKGDYAFVIGKANENKLYAFKKGSGLVAGIGDEFTVVSSDLPSILPLTKKVVFMNDGEIIELSDNHFTIYSVSDGSTIERSIEIVEETMEAAQKGGFEHFMLKEIHEQPEVARALLHLWNDSPAITATVEALRKARNIYFIGCGTSYNACVAGAVFFNRLCAITIIPVAAPQLIAQYNHSIDSGDVGIFVSQSGETKDVLNAVEVARKQGMRIFSLVNVVGSTLTKLSEEWLPLACGYEISVPATKTFTNQLVGFLYLAYRVSNRDLHELDHLSEFLQDTIRDTNQQVIEILPHLVDWNDLYSLGYGITLPIALEAALKLKEITYAHCEGMLSTEFKHGPLAAVTKDFPVIFSTIREDIPIIISGINEVTCRGARAIVVGPEDQRLESNAQHTISISEPTPEISSILAIIPLQLLSYHMSVQRGFDPDFPRNLSKTLTVD
ncbi:MAG: glutamine--fructose-6-phosphate transaminase (isomerizing) [Anaerolineaceae bacterium]|jgi:glucosamine--fructose-6-phosphate aminotransferase (isomerizing)|nr:glutamine--fructose-6-phosphate transaminase (isomerizing) [Anaerolineaceae bacterium]